MLERSLELSSTELLQANSQMRAVLEAFPDLFIWLGKDDRIQEVKDSSREDRHWSLQHRLGTRLQDGDDKEVARLYSDALEQVKQTNETRTIEYRFADKADVAFFEARIIPTALDQILVIIRNVTQRKLAEEEHLQRSKLESVGLLAGGIAHDFNNSLTVISAGLSLSRLSTEEGSEIERTLAETETAVLRARDLTSQLLTFSKGGSPIKETASVGELLRESVQFALRGSNVRCELKIPSDLWPVSMDAGQINQVINNLVINAKQAMSRGGSLWVHAKNLVETNQVLLVVRDEGLGMSEEVLSQIFDPYFTTKETGSGLGLASSYSIIVNHGGLITATSTFGEGTQFEITLPRSMEKIAPTRKRTRKIQKGQGRVLVMDDEEPIRHFTARLLKRLGYDAEVACDGEETITAYREALHAGNPFDVVIMDLTVPGGMGGKDAVTELLHIDPTVKTVASSGYSNDPVLANYTTHGFSSILSKPYTIQQLSAVLADLLVP